MIQQHDMDNFGGRTHPMLGPSHQVNTDPPNLPGCGEPATRKSALARASAGLTDSTIRNDANHLELVRDWFGRPLWEMQPADADTYFGKVLREAKPSTRTGRAAALTVYR
jgi:hypothetical protein